VAEQQQQTVLTKEEGGCPGSSQSDLMVMSRSLSLTSVLLLSCTSPDFGEDNNADPMPVVEMMSLLGGLLREEEEGDHLIAVQKSSAGSLEEDKQGDSNIAVQEKLSVDSSEEEGEGDPSITHKTNSSVGSSEEEEQGEAVDVTEKSSS
jgi:hypothetical protein